MNLRTAATSARAAGKQAPRSSLDLLMDEWRASKWPPRIQRCVRRVLNELCAQSILVLRREPRLEVMVRPEAEHSVWAYFPMHPELQTPRQATPKPSSMADFRRVLRAATDELYRRRLAAQKYKPKPATRVLLVLSEKHFAEQSIRKSEDQLRDHFGHVLLYLRDPKASNDCANAMRTWRASSEIARKAAFARWKGPREGQVG